MHPVTFVFIGLILGSLITLAVLAIIEERR
jgi:hypothetical protein